MREFYDAEMKKLILLSFILLSVQVAQASQVSITMDDPNINATPFYSASERNQHILDALKNEKLHAALFVSGKNVNHNEGAALLKTWDQAGHSIANHTYSHWYYHSENLSAEDFIKDAFRVETLISGLKNFKKLFRYPMLKEGNTIEKREKMRDQLQARGYKQGYVTIDASDWYIDERLIARLANDPSANIIPYKDFYLKHIWERAQYYDGLAKNVFGREIKHTLLIHHNLLNALFLKDVLQMFKSKGWTLISTEEAFKDPVFNLKPNILPAGESIVWAAAKETGKFEAELRYPGESDVYEKPSMDRLGL
jgi:peptidoglycan/xylan/chitin deacetylase (PgdA/CDA1 family)